ncbi:MAG: hypothetical protein II007_09020 [Gammaproteobacteria bacterium]|nr:hypothetical protein [Gammaproteobacteria bacterium]
MAVTSHNLPIIIDVEASGFGRGSYPIEIGIAMGDGVSSRCYLIAPEPEWQHWDKAAERVHGISRATLQRYGQPARWVADQLNELLWGQTVCSDAWAHDSSWIGKLYDVVGSHPRFRIVTLREQMSDEQLHYWQPARDQLTRAHAQRHRASTDARLIQQTFALSQRFAKESFSLPLSR